jgi:hypothetical protein
VTQGVGEFAFTEAAERRKEATRSQGLSGGDATRSHGPGGERKEDTETHGPDDPPPAGPSEDTKTRG